VVEPNIVRAVGAVSREPVRETTRQEPAMRSGAGANDGGWPLQPINEPVAPPAPAPSRSYRASEDTWAPPEPAAPRARSADSLTGLAAELSSRLNPPDVPHSPPAREPAPRTMAPPQDAAPSNDHNLAEMAQQLEAALRRPPAGDGRPPVTDPLAVPPSRGQDPRPPRETRPRLEPKFESKFEQRGEPRREGAPDFKPEPRFEPAGKPGKQLYENLEDEMASLLGRPSGKS
jgi:hypothetical protein